MSNYQNETHRWAEEVCSQLQHMLDCMEYEPPISRRYVDFFRSDLAPALGRFPNSSENDTAWKSYMTDDYTPVEYSHSYTSKGQAVRMAIEPIGPNAGSVLDPFNVKETDQMIRKLASSVGRADLTWYNILCTKLMEDTNQLHAYVRQNLGGNVPQLFVAFDFGRRQASMKVYFFPTTKATLQKKTSMKLVAEMLPHLEATSKPLLPAFQLVEGYLSKGHVQVPKLEIVSIDTCNPLDSRLKLYIRQRGTSFERVWDFFTLGGTINYMHTDEAFLALKSIWYLVLGLPKDCSVSQELPENNHETAGVICYFALRPGNPIPEPKIYIPVRHYARDDQAIANGLVQAFQELGWENHAKNYMRNLKSIFPHRSLCTKTGIQTYIAFSMKNGQVTIEPYLSPEIRSRSHTDASEASSTMGLGTVQKGIPMFDCNLQLRQGQPSADTVQMPCITSTSTGIIV